MYTFPFERAAQVLTSHDMHLALINQHQVHDLAFDLVVEERSVTNLVSLLQFPWNRSFANANLGLQIRLVPGFPVQLQSEEKLQEFTTKKLMELNQSL